MIKSSIEKAPLIRKFTVLFIVMSLIPFLVIAYLFTQYDQTGKINIDKNVLLILLFLSGLGELVGFWGMHISIIKIQQITKKTKEILGKAIPDIKDIDETDSEVYQLTKAFNEVTANLENNIKRLEASKQTMQFVLSKIALGLASEHKIDTFLELIVEVTANALDAKFGFLLLRDEKKDELYVKAASGFENKFKDIRIKFGEEAPGWVAKNKKPLMIPKIHKGEAKATPDEPFESPLLCTPLLYKDRIVGVLGVAGKIVGDNFAEDSLIIISNLASQTAVAVENERLHVDAEKTYLETISALALAVEARDPYSRGHLDRVSTYSVRIAKRLGLDEMAIKEIEDAAELHDVGKIGISDEILKKYGALDDLETQVMKKHPIIGESIIMPIRTLQNLCPLVRSHHEWVNGQGYPDGLKGDEIPLGAKILAVSDSFDAMVTDRPYHKGMTFDEAKEKLKRYIGIRYDKKVVEAFFQVIDEMKK